MRPSTKNHQRAWMLVITLSLLLHFFLVTWFSSRTPKFPDVNPNEFKVGLMSSEGTGDTLQASLPDIVAVADVETEESGIVSQQEIAKDLSQEQILEITEQVPIEQTLIENVELATVVTPETSFLPDVSPPALQNKNETPDQKPEQSQPVETVATLMPAMASTDIETVETVGVSAEIEDVAPSNDFFKPAEVLSADEPLSTLPIEQLSAVAAPEAILANISPELAKHDVEILEIKARDLIIQKRPVPPKPKPVVTQGENGNSSLSSAQSLLARSGQRSVESANSPSSDQSKLTPLAIPKEYMLELKSWLNLYKKYPQQAYRLKQQGVVIVSLKVEKTGKIISSEIKRSSGHKLLDQEVNNMIKRASKIPALPADFPRDTLELLIPIRFKVR